VTGGWGATEISQSVDSIVVPNTPSAPTSPTEINCTEDVVAGKTYATHTFQWTNTVGSGHYTDLLSSTTNDPATASVVNTEPVVGSTDQMDWTVLKSPGGSSTPVYLWVRHRLSTGEVSDATAISGSPYTPTDGCAL